jgi:hypothetical protein
MAWRYELRGNDNRLVEMRRGFVTEGDARDAGERSKRMNQSITSSPEKIRVVLIDDGG